MTSALAEESYSVSPKPRDSAVTTSWLYSKLVWTEPIPYSLTVVKIDPGFCWKGVITLYTIHVIL